MKVERIFSEHRLPISLDEAWAFFSTPKNLNEITPPEMKFRITSEIADEMYEGQIITYRIRLAPLVWCTWVTEIKNVEPKHCFVDEQRFGPYKMWHHRHTFVEDGDGVRATDEVHYAVGFGIFGTIANAVYVRNQVQGIFEYREKALTERFGK